jgi:hypothetical protein
MSVMMVEDKMTDVILIVLADSMRSIRHLWGYNFRHNKVILVINVVLVKFESCFVSMHNLDKNDNVICAIGEKEQGLYK